MRYSKAISLAPLLFALGCSSTKTNTVLIGGERVMFYPAGTAVPAVEASANTNGWYSLTADELDGLMNP